MLAGKDARQLARELLAMSQAEFSAAFRNSPMKRAKLRGLKRNAAVSMGNVGTASDVPTLLSALGDPEPLVRVHVAWALGRIGSPGRSDRSGPDSSEEEDTSASAELRAALLALGN